MVASRLFLWWAGDATSPAGQCLDHLLRLPSEDPAILEEYKATEPRRIARTGYQGTLSKGNAWEQQFESVRGRQHVAVELLLPRASPTSVNVRGTWTDVVRGGIEESRSY